MVRSIILRHAAARRTEEHALARGRAVDDVVGRAEVLANQLRLVLVERPLEMRREEAVHDVHAGRQAELGHAPQDQRLVGRLLGVLAEDDDPAGVERAVDVVVPAVHVQRVLGQRARRHLQHHRRALAGGVVVLLDAVDDALAGGVVDDALPADRVRDGAALGRVLAFGLDGDRVVAEDVELALGKRLLVELAAFSRRRDGIEDTGVGDARFGVVGNQLVPVGGDADSRKWRTTLHDTSPCRWGQHARRAPRRARPPAPFVGVPGAARRRRRWASPTRRSRRNACRWPLCACRR